VKKTDIPSITHIPSHLSIFHESSVLIRNGYIFSEKGSSYLYILQLVDDSPVDIGIFSVKIWPALIEISKAKFNHLRILKKGRSARLRWK
jgi:hypothetical protein